MTQLARAGPGILVDPQVGKEAAGKLPQAVDKAVFICLGTGRPPGGQERALGLRVASPDPGGGGGCKMTVQLLLLISQMCCNHKTQVCSHVAMHSSCKVDASYPNGALLETLQFGSHACAQFWLCIATMDHIVVRAWYSIKLQSCCSSPVAWYLVN